MTWQASTLHDVLARRAAERGDAEALVTQTSRLTYAQLYSQARELAASMYAHGVRRGDHVALLAPNDVSWVRVFCAAAMLGAVTVPVNTRFKASELQFCLRKSGSSILFLVDRFLNIDFIRFLREAEPAVDARLPGATLPALRTVVTSGEECPAGATGYEDFRRLAERVDRDAFADAIACVQPDDVLLIQFTSGTTAYPKGVLLSHDNMLRNAAATGSRIGITSDDRYFNCRPFFHVAGSTLSLLMSIQAGACLVTLPTFEPAGALAMMARERCSLTSGNDTIFQMMMAHADFDPCRLSLRGGWAAAGPETMRQIIEQLGARAICSAYGLSEASPNVAMSDWRDPEALRVAGLARPLDGVDVQICDPSTNAAVEPGQVGEIQVRGWNVMRGYHDNLEASAAAFTADGWLRTGDIGTLDGDGRLRFVGRIKDVFRVGGENVAPAEVEEVLIGHPAIATAQVIGVPDPRLGEVPAAFVTLISGETVSPDEIMAWARERCANFRAPRYVRIVDSFDAIGMTASGKVQKAKLRDHAIAVLGLDAANT